jgi:hypothetical protein
MIRPQVTEYIPMWMVVNTKVNGKMINNTERVRKSGLMADGLKEITKRAKKAAMEYSYGLVVLNTKVDLN